MFEHARIFAAGEWAYANATRLLDDLEAADAEILRLAIPCPGDIESQAAAWVAVWKELEAAGMLSYVGDLRDMRGRTRAVEFIRHLAAAVAAQRERDAAICDRLASDSTDYLECKAHRTAAERIRSQQL